MAVAPYAHGMGGYASSSFSLRRCSYPYLFASFFILSLPLSFILSCSLSEWDAVGGVGENGTERQKGDSGGTKHGTKTKEGESDEIGTLGLRQQRTGQDGKSDEIGTLGDGGKGQDGKSEGTHGWKRRSSRMRCLL